MSLSQKIAAALDENTRAYVLPCSVAVEDPPHRLVVNLSSLDSVGLSFGSLEFATTARTEWTTELLRAWGDRLAARVTYLMEPLKVLEVDVQGGAALIRSHNPSARVDRQSYYEVSLKRDGGLRMERFTFDSSSRQRQQTQCQLTREAFERLADDIVASLP